jgi:ferredoxin
MDIRLPGEFKKEDSNMVKVRIDQDTCIECGTCVGVCSEVFELAATGKAQLVEKYRVENVASGEVPDDIAWVKPAAEECPVDAIAVG